jgi:CheY-like chemotaxis protein
MRKRLTQISMDYKILVLDDEEGIINSIKVMLNRNGYYCVGVTNPLEAIEVLKNQTFDMLILA